MITVIFGKRGVGKSTYCKNIVDTSVLPVVVIDTMNEYNKQSIRMVITDDIVFDMFKVRLVPKDNVEFAISMQLISNIRYKYGVNVVIDEVDMWSNPHMIPVELENALKFSRHYKLNFWCTVRSPQEVNKKITSLADKFIMFKVTEPRALEYFSQFNKDLPDILRNLKPYEYHVYEL